MPDWCISSLNQSEKHCREHKTQCSKKECGAKARLQGAVLEAFVSTLLAFQTHYCWLLVWTPITPKRFIPSSRYRVRSRIQNLSKFPRSGVWNLAWHGMMIVGLTNSKSSKHILRVRCSNNVWSIADKSKPDSILDAKEAFSRFWLIPNSKSG